MNFFNLQKLRERNPVGMEQRKTVSSISLLFFPIYFHPPKSQVLSHAEFVSVKGDFSALPQLINDSQWHTNKPPATIKMPFDNLLFFVKAGKWVASAVRKQRVSGLNEKGATKKFEFMIFNYWYSSFPPFSFRKEKTDFMLSNRIVNILISSEQRSAINGIPFHAILKRSLACQNNVKRL